MRRSWDGRSHDQARARARVAAVGDPLDLRSVPEDLHDPELVDRRDAGADRRLERLGLIERTVLRVSPVAVEYSVTPLGESLKDPFQAIFQWTVVHGPERDAAKRKFDSEQCV